jgi:hypothetical protein
VRVETRVSAMGTSFASWQEVQSVAKKTAPEGTYDVPSDFKKVDTFPGGQQ